ncbi:hypothetical protein OG455_27850 [Kitasatospora sp. NBC_01287]|uniref:hypothetical protein n=1 Tax=Kitasatospora sp. NBC_01287 TaxID=2903573 RepID=UPI0022527F7E|nr:hypothetical protein [Kitasatospora sp. NBC_01287]MCX4749276.1 hypothetical protein [Kitasatospora sp. NBC_01287]
MAQIATEGFIAVEVRGPEHHHLPILEAFLHHRVGPGLSQNSFALTEHAITAAWSVRPNILEPLTFSQFHDLVAHFHYADLVRQALDVDADFDRIGELVSTISRALLLDNRLRGTNRTH